MTKKRKKSPVKRYRVEVYVCTYKTVTVCARTERSAESKARTKVAKMTRISRRENEVMSVDVKY